jgi:sec-independent protein translocase protein TatB
MDSFFGIGAPELILILVIAGLVMGPERIGRTARWLGRMTSQLQNISRGFVRQLNAELDVDGTDEIKGAWNEMQDLRRQINDLKGELTSVTHNALKDGTKPLADIKEEVERTIAPPSLMAPASDGAAASDTPPEPPELPKRIEVVDDPEE